VLDMTAQYIDRTFEGEAILTVGKTIDFINKGLAGVVSAMPFTCMPGTISHAIIKRVKEEMVIAVPSDGQTGVATKIEKSDGHRTGFPFLNLVYDGTEQANYATRLEAFMHQAKEYVKTTGGVKVHI